MKMVDKNSIELQIKALEKSFVTIVKAVKEIKAGMTKLEEKVNKNDSDKMEELTISQKNLDDLIVANANAIKRIDDEILGFKHDKADCNADKEQVETKEKTCRYFNRGHCKYKQKCKFFHSKEICQTYLEGGKCDAKICKSRHPKVCKWWQGSNGCGRNNCDFLHVTLVSDDDQNRGSQENYPCSGCKNYYDDRNCVVEHTIKHTKLFLCLNCNSWIQRKEEILNVGWSMFNEFGDLKRDV